MISNAFLKISARDLGDVWEKVLNASWDESTEEIASWTVASATSAITDVSVGL